MTRYIPEQIRAFVGDMPYEVDDMGCSGAAVLTYDEYVLKIEAWSEKWDKTVQMMRWLQDRLPSPKVVCAVHEDDKGYLLMSRIEGRMAVDKYYLEHPVELAEHLAEAMHMLWSVDITDCPRVRDLDTELAEGAYRVEQHLVDVGRAEPTTFGENGEFRDPEHLLEWLRDNRPECEPVLSHGDLCLPNVFFKDGKVSGFIDLGDAGVGDRWRDIALCYRSFKHNMDGPFGDRIYDGFTPELLFEKLGIEPNWEKLRYYILLDELF